MTTAGQRTEEASLLSRLQRGDENAFHMLYERHQPAIFRYSLRMSGSEAVAEDVVQEVFLALIRGARGYDAEAGPLRSYLYGMARRILLKQEQPSAAAEEFPMEPSTDVNPLEGMERAEQVGRLRQALSALPPHYREVVVLCDLEEMDYAAAAEMLGAAVGTVRSRLHRARALLLERLSQSRIVA